MKNPKFRPVHKKREITTNSAQDTHKKFCDRCYARNGNKYCPKQGMGVCDI